MNYTDLRMYEVFFLGMVLFRSEKTIKKQVSFC